MNCFINCVLAIDKNCKQVDMIFQGKGREGKGREGKGREGKGREEKRREEKRREEKRREEKRREEKRREEKRREEKRRELYMSCQREKQHNVMRISFFFTLFKLLDNKLRTYEIKRVKTY